MPTPILLPDLRAGAVTLSVWYAEPGEPVMEGERIVEMLADGATVDVLAPASGRLLEKHVFFGDALTAGMVLGMIE
jgi:pyruvate/2-oxoglutarate dehydrogenase complex dihydrolipoamide acyltransferase (E2) component